MRNAEMTEAEIDAQLDAYYDGLEDSMIGKTADDQDPEWDEIDKHIDDDARWYFDMRWR